MGRAFFGGGDEAGRGGGGGDGAGPRKVEDLLFLQAAAYEGRSWVSGSPLVQPQVALAGGGPETWPPGRLAEYRAKLRRVREIAERYAGAAGESEREMGRIAAFIVRRWDEAAPSVSKGGAE